VITTAVTPVVVALVGEGVRRPVDKIGAVASTVTEKDMPEQENRSEKAKEQRPTRRHHHLRIALIIEALAFVIAVAAITAIELVGGDWVSGSGRTTFFGGKSQHANKKAEPSQQDRQRQEKTTPTSTQEEQTTPTATGKEKTAPTETNGQTNTSEPAP
jgi:cytoskeletal protein RodZ